MGLFWFFLLVAPQGLGILSSLRVDLAGIRGHPVAAPACLPRLSGPDDHPGEKPALPAGSRPLRTDGGLPLLFAAYLKDPVTRLLIPVWCYIVIFLSLLWIGKPYLYRDMVNKICSKPSWWTPLCLGGMAYGAAILLCAILWW